jgi:hypothetical protein
VTAVPATTECDGSYTVPVIALDVPLWPEARKEEVKAKARRVWTTRLNQLLAIANFFTVPTLT